MSSGPETVKRIRKNFGKIEKIIEIPDLIGMQRDSYNRFLQMDTLPEDRESSGLQAVFQSVFPIKDFTGTASLEFVSYRFGEIKSSVEECVHRGMTYEIAVRISQALELRLDEKQASALQQPPTKDVQAYEHYLRGRERFFDLLAAGGSRKPVELLKSLGIDITRAEFWQGGCDLVRDNVQRARELASKEA